MLLETSVETLTCYENIRDIGRVIGSANTEVYSPHLFLKGMLNFRKVSKIKDIIFFIHIHKHIEFYPWSTWGPWTPGRMKKHLWCGQDKHNLLCHDLGNTVLRAILSFIKSKSPSPQEKQIIAFTFWTARMAC